jgi:hypothetical protein
MPAPSRRRLASPLLPPTSASSSRAFSTCSDVYFRLRASGPMPLILAVGADAALIRSPHHGPRTFPTLCRRAVSSIRTVSSVSVDELQNSFRPGAGSPPPALIGRDDLISRFRVTVGRALVGRPGQSVMPIGLRGVGKTVLLNRFNEIAQDEGLQVGYIEAPESGNFPRLLATRLRTILVALDRAGVASRAAQRALGVLRSFTYTLPDGSSISLGVDPLVGAADSGQLSEDLTDLLVAAGEAARDRKTGIVLAIDEVQYLSGDELAALISAIHRTVQLDLPVVLVGAGLPQHRGSRGTPSRMPSASSSFRRSGPSQRAKPGTS